MRCPYRALHLSGHMTGLLISHGQTWLASALADTDSIALCTKDTNTFCVLFPGCILSLVHLIALRESPERPLHSGMIISISNVFLVWWHMLLSHVTRQIRRECDFTRGAKISGVTAAEAYLCSLQTERASVRMVSIIFMRPLKQVLLLLKHWRGTATLNLAFFHVSVSPAECQFS